MVIVTPRSSAVVRVEDRIISELSESAAVD